MYKCNLMIYIVGRDKSLRSIENIEPLEHFTHEFMISDYYCTNLAKLADIIIIDLSSSIVDEVLSEAYFTMKPNSQLITIMTKEQINYVLNSSFDTSRIADIWTPPIDEKEIKFKFTRWQRSMKDNKDLWQSNIFLDTLINGIPFMVWFKNKIGAHIKVNDYFAKVVNKTKEQIKGKGHYYVWGLTPDEYAKGDFICMESEHQVMDKKQTMVFDEQVKIKNGIRQLETYKSPLFDIDGSVMGTVGMAVDVTEKKKYEKELINSANCDSLTGLYNRHYLYEFLKTPESYSEAYTAYCIDLDNFKTINDTYGHAKGDEALIVAAKTLLLNCVYDIVVRTGGDEFLVLSLGKKTGEEIEQKRLYIKESLKKAFNNTENLEIITASIGSAYSEQKDIISFEELFKVADAAMYKEKQTNKVNR